MITEISTDKKYIGVRSCKINPKLDLGLKYFSSSRDEKFIANQAINPDNYKYEILSTHETRDLANKEEYRLHDLYDVGVNEQFYNKAKSSSYGFCIAGKITVKDKNGNTLAVNKDDPRYLSGELVHHTKGMHTVKHSITGETTTMPLDDQRYLSGEYVSISKGMIRCYDKLGNIHKVSNTDERFLAGELIAFSKDKLIAKDKNNNLYQVYKDDERLLNGELVSYFTDMVTIRNSDGTCSTISKEQFDGDDSLKGVNVGKVLCKDKDGNCFVVSKDDERILSGELIGFAANKVNVFDPVTGETMQVSKDDPRYISKELLPTNYMKSSEERSEIAGLGKKYVTDLKTYKIKRVDENYVLSEYESFGMLKDPNKPKKIRKKTAINVNDFSFKPVDHDYILKENEIFGNGVTIASLKKKAHIV